MPRVALPSSTATNSFPAVGAALTSAPVVLALLALSCCTARDRRAPPEAGISPREVLSRTAAPAPPAARTDELEREREAVSNFQEHVASPARAHDTEDCTAGDASACERAGNGLITSGDFVAAVPLLEKACAGNARLACANLGVLYRRGQGVTANADKALAYYRRACNDAQPGGEAMGCAHLGNAYREGRGVTMDLGEARRLYEIACNGGSDQGCTNLGVMHEKGLGAPADMPLAIRAYERGCRLGAGAACSNLAVVYRDGRGTEIDTSKATALFSLACKLHHARSCEEAARRAP